MSAARTHQQQQWVAQLRNYSRQALLLHSATQLPLIRESVTASTAKARSHEREEMVERPWKDPSLQYHNTETKTNPNNSQFDSGCCPKWVHPLLNSFHDSSTATPAPIVAQKCRKTVRVTDRNEKFQPQGNAFSWTKFISEHTKCGKSREALRIYKEMREEGVIPSTYTFVAVLKACSTVRDLEAGKKIHVHVTESGNQSDIFVVTTLLDMYVKCGSMVDARRVFEKMPHRDVVSWTAMIIGYAQKEEGELALKLYERMQHEGFTPDDRTFVAALKACAAQAVREEGKEVDGEVIKIGCLKKGKVIHSQVAKSGFASDIFVATALLDMYVKCGSMVHAREVFEEMPHRDAVPWNAMIIGYAQMDKGDMALQLYARMQYEGFTPDVYTFVAALKACGSLVAQQEGKEIDGELIKIRCLAKGRAIHTQVAKSGLESNIFVANTLVDMYAKCGSMVDACMVFDAMLYRTVVSWNAMIMGYAQMEMGALALQFYARMQHEGFTPDDRTFVAALKACSSLASLETGKEIHAKICRAGLEGELFVANCLIDMYGKCGSMMDAQQLFDASPVKDVVTWNALIAAYSSQGDCERVFELFERMQCTGFEPVGITFVSILTVCSHTGLVDKGQKYFQAMCLDYGIIPHSEHYSCMMDLLGRAGQLDEAVAMVKKMPFEPLIVTWLTIMGACRQWNNLEIGRHAFECSVRLDGKCAAAYVLMTNIYISAQMWKDSASIQDMRMNARAWGKPGECWWTDNVVVHKFRTKHRNNPYMQS